MDIQLKYQILFSYHWYTNERLIDFAGNLSDYDYKMSSGYGNGSIHEIFSHILRVDQAWRLSIGATKQHPPVDINDFPSINLIKAGFDAEHREWDILLSKLSDEYIANNIIIRNIKGKEYAFPCWRVLEHVILHGMQHHAEISQLLTAKGHSPSNIDFLFYRND